MSVSTPDTPGLPWFITTPTCPLLELSSTPGFTGETGAGKSIAIDALGIALGDRAESSVVRNGAKRAEINASFDIGDRRTAVPMTEVSPGHYQGAYQVQVQDQFQGALIIGRLKNDKGWTRKRIYKSHSYPTNT